MATLVERFSRFTILVKVDGKDTISVIEALKKQIGCLPDLLCLSLTWDRGMELANHKQLSMATNIQVYFCDPKSPWQRETNENTNRLLRQYFPKKTDLSIYSQHELDQVAIQLNQRPRKTLNFLSPADKLNEIVAMTVLTQGGVLCKPIAVKCAFIRDNTEFYPVRLLCKCLEVPKSIYYQCLNTPFSKRQQQTKELDDMIKAIFYDHKCRYGVNRITIELKAQGIPCTRARISERMRELFLIAKARRKLKVTTDSSHKHPISKNILQQDFSATKQNQKWLTDITYIQTQKG